MGLNQSTHGTWNTNAICNLHLATGKICRPGSGPFSLTGQPNAMGGREMGYMGPGLPGQRSTMSADDRAYVEQAWGIAAGTLRPEAGSGTVAMFENMVAGKIKACWIICTNPVASAPNRKKVIAGLEACELVITQDAYLETETNAYANIVLPGALWAEAEGVMINSERNMTLMRKAVEPPGRRCRTGRSSPGSPARWVTGAHSPTSWPPRCSRRFASSGIRRPATTSAAPATRSWRRPRFNGRSPRRPRATAIRSATSTTASASPCALRRTDAGPRSPSSPSAARRSSCRAPTCLPRRCPTPTSPSCSTPAACSISGTR